MSFFEEEDEFPIFQVFKVSANQRLDPSFETLKALSGVIQVSGIRVNMSLL